ncbi:MAG TPA: thioredoxin domain-containing protein, partial [Candidatus Nanoarchaeia archaeon]|nr:thioredoxin domain-containing protein [Candidatus Nanoarchaeia archaeon]
MKNLAAAIVILVILIFVAVGCTTTQQAEQQTSGGKTEAAAAAVPAKQLAKNFHEFDQATYDAALKEGKIIFLDFYASWCPICKEEEPEIKAAFNELNTDNVIGFRV